MKWVIGQCFPTFFQPRHTLLDPLTRRTLQLRHFFIFLGAVHIVRKLFLTNFDPPPPPVTLCHASQDHPKYVTHLGPPFLVGLVQKTRTKTPCTNSISNSISIVRGVLVREILSEGL